MDELAAAGVRRDPETGKLLCEYDDECPVQAVKQVNGKGLCHHHLRIVEGRPDRRFSAARASGEAKGPPAGSAPTLRHNPEPVAFRDDDLQRLAKLVVDELYARMTAKHLVFELNP
jgi:hypothetical protein